VFAIEEIARGCPNTALALISCVGVVSLAIIQYGTEEQKRKYLPPIAAGTAVSAICMTEPTAGSATSQVQTNATRRGDHYVVTGRKCMISRGGLSDYYLVVCRFESQPGLNGVGAVIIDRGTPGLSFGKAEDTLGFRGVPATDMIMEECMIPVANVLMGAGGFKKMIDGLPPLQLLGSQGWLRHARCTKSCWQIQRHTDSHRVRLNGQTGWTNGVQGSDHRRGIGGAGEACQHGREFRRGRVEIDRERRQLRLDPTFRHCEQA
jgi:alkylation response protein AidB-like acyl-CoA dehydrogenase